MDLNATLAQLENAAAIIMAPPTSVSNEDRTKAEIIFHTFRKTDSALQLCSFIVENERSSEFVLFETAEVLRSNLLQEMSRGSTHGWNILCKSLIDHLYKNDRFSYSVQRRLAGVVALILKYESIVQNLAKRAELMKYIEEMNNSDHKFLVTCCIFEALLGEHQFVANSTNPVFTYETNFAAKRNFENTDLLRIFQSCLMFMSVYEHNRGKHQEFDRILKLVESILFWNFSKACLPKRVASILEMEATPTFKPPLSWGELIGNAAFIPTFFDVHVKIRGDEAFIPRTLNILLQLVTLHGPLVSTKNDRTTLLNRLIPPFVSLLEMPYKLPSEVAGLSEIVRKILLSDRCSTLCTVQPQFLQNFLVAVGKFSCQVIPQAILEETKCGIDDRIFRDSATRVLEAWMNILTDTDNIPIDVIQPMVTKMFETFLYGHISPPEGFRNRVEDVEDIDEEDGSDSVLFTEQLQAVGLFGRFILRHSVPTLTNLLNFKCRTFQARIEEIVSQGITEANYNLDTIYEDLHWAVLIAGHTISFDGSGETNLIPAEINQFSVDNGGSPEASVHAMTGVLSMQIVPEDNADPVCKLISSAFYLSELERRMMESNLSQLLSPEVTSNTLWFLNRWAQVYFMFGADHYTTISPCFSMVWGESSPSSATIQSTLFRRIRQDLITFTGEECILIESLNLLQSLINSNKKSALAMQSPELASLIELLCEVGPGKYQISMSMYRKFVRAMITVGNFCNDEIKREFYWEQILGSLKSRYQNFVRLNPNERHLDEVRLEISYVLSGFIGAAMSSESKVASTLFDKLKVIASECGAILNAYHNYNDIVELCLEFISQLGKRSLSYLSRGESMTLYDAAMSVVKSYAVHATGRKTSERNAEEDSDLVLLIDMLSSLLTKDFLDLSAEAFENNGPPPVSASEVCLQGVGVILPLMNADLLEYPNLSAKYFRLIAFLSELHPDKLILLERWMLQAMFQSVQLGLSKSTPDTFASCCDFITCVVNHLSRTTQHSSYPGDLAEPFVKIFLEMILSEKIGRESVSSISSALFSLISAFRKQFDELALQLIGSRECEQVRKKLTEAFLNLTLNLNMQAGGDRNSRTIFRDRLDSFIFLARGCIDLIEVRY